MVVRVVDVKCSSGYSVIVLLFYSVTVLWCYGFMVLLCYCVIFVSPDRKTIHYTQQHSINST